MSRPLECNEVRSGLDDHRRGDLPAEDRAAVDWHLRGCAGCAAALADAQALGGLLRLRVDLLAEDGLPKDFTARVMAALPPSPTSLGARLARIWRERRSLLLGGLVLASLCAAVVLPLVLRRDRAGSSLASEMAENEAHIHKLEVQSPDSHPVVFQNSEGRTVIWVVSDTEDADPAPPPKGPSR